MSKIYSSNLTLTPAERKQISFLIVESNTQERAQLKQILRNSGYEQIFEANSHTLAKDKLFERRVSHIIFECKKTTMPVDQFVSEVLEVDPKLTLIASSANPKLDDVFNLLTKGARGYLIKPYTQDGVDQAIILATKADPFPEAVLKAKDRNEALAVLVVTALDKLASTLRQTEEFETAKKELPKLTLLLERSVEIATTFSRGEEEGYVKALVEQCIARQNSPSSRLGRLRKRMKLDKDCAGAF